MPKAKPARAQPKAQDPVKVDPKHYKVEAENKQVRVLRISYGPHEKSVMHGHPATVAVFPERGSRAIHFPGRQDGGAQLDGEAEPFHPRRDPFARESHRQAAGVGLS